MFGCREPTEAYLELATNAVCEDVVATSITIAQPGELEAALADTTTRRCSSVDGRIGSLTVVPADEDNDSFSVRVVTGLGKSPDECVADNYTGGCIVARRSLRFIPHRTLHLPIDMLAICRDIPCGETQTCKNGHCVDAKITDIDACLSAKGCDVFAPDADGTGGTSAAVGSSAYAGSTASSSGGTTYVTANGGTSPFAGNSSSGGFGGASGSTSSLAASVSGGAALTFGGSGGSETGGAAFIDAGGTQALGGTLSGGALSTGGNSSGGMSTADSTVAEGGTPASGGVLGHGGTSISDGTTATSGGTAFSGGTAGSRLSGGGSGARAGESPAGASSNGGSTQVGGTSAGAGTTQNGAGGSAGTTTLPSVCGDGLRDPWAGEYCDDAGDSPTCNADCSPSRCGDGVTNHAAGELCDGSTAVINCTPSCTISACGDGYVDTRTDEQCEAGMGGCTACKQDVAGLANALRVSAKRSELLMNMLAFDITVSNSGAAVSTDGLTLRYYFTPDSSSAQSVDCTWSDLGCGNITASVKTLAKTCTNANRYVELAIRANATLNTGSSLEIQGNVTGGLLNLYNFGNDYSRPSGLLLAQETQMIALFQNGKLVWGIPPCGCGNGVLDSGEVCDHGGESAFCNADCTLARCGDAKVNAVAGETCDSGTPSLSCSPECQSTGLPASASSSLLLWIDAAQPASIVLAPRVSVARDRSGKANHITQPNAHAQPFWFPSVFGSLPALYFNGIDQEMSAATPVNDVGRGSILLVHKVSPVGLTATLLANGWFQSGGGFAVRTRPQLDGLGIALGSTTGFSTTQWTLGARSDASPPSPSVTYWSWEPPAFNWTSDTSSESLNAAVSYTSTTHPLALGGLNAGEPFTGWIGEVLLFDRALTLTERDALLAYLRAKWAVP
ncbi:MAG TPA: cellulose binding domain-containing protein [Polyangiaceae bacterium]